MIDLVTNIRPGEFPGSNAKLPHCIPVLRQLLRSPDCFIQNEFPVVLALATVTKQLHFGAKKRPFITERPCMCMKSGMASALALSAEFSLD
jgi:hypothetical protein